MTAPSEAEEVERSELVIPHPLPHQLEDFESADRFKMLRWGRRTGKTRFDFIGATVGHGPGWRESRPMFPGILSPVEKCDVLWIGKNNSQASQIWLEELLPRFEPLELAGACEIMRAPDRRVSLDGFGTLHLRSAEAIGSVRGLGNRLIGVICDEAAWWAWLEAWRKEIRPVLMDNEGWAIISSTTNGGPDGELNELGDKISPSGFNRRCLEVMRGAPGFTRGDGWRHSHKTARENPKIKPLEFAATLREYPPGSISLEQEMEAKLVAGGSGLAFPEWRDELHIIRMEAPPDAAWFGSIDWGYSPRPTIAYEIAGYGDRKVHYRHEHKWLETIPYRVGYEWGQHLKARPPLEWIACDPSMGSKTTGESIMEAMQRGLDDAFAPRRAPPLILAPAGHVLGKDQRRQRKLQLHELLAYEEKRLGDIWIAEGQDPEDWEPDQLLMADERIVPEWLRPKGSWHPDCVEWISSVPLIGRDPHGKEDVDTKANDDPYDGGTYGLTARIVQNREDDRDKPPGSRDRHPGMTDAGERKDPHKSIEPNADKPFRTGVKWRWQGNAKRGHPEDRDDEDLD